MFVTFNPFNIRSIYLTQVSKVPFFRMDKLNVNGKEIDVKETLYFTTMAHIMRKIGGKFCSPILTERDVERARDTFKYLANFYFVMFSWTILSLLLMFFVEIADGNLSRDWLMGIVGVWFSVGIILMIYFMVRWQLSMKKLGDEFWARRAAIVIPDGYRRKAILSFLEKIKGEIISYTAGESVNLLGNETVKAIHDLAEIGIEIKTAKNKNDT